MSEAPERIWVGVSELGDLAINHKGEKLNGYDHVEYIRADCIETLERDAKAHEKEIAVWSENYAAMERKLEAARADTKKAVQAAYEEGFLAGTADGWVNNPRIKAEWKRSKARATLAEIEGEK
jgi:hypothetical protein